MRVIVLMMALGAMATTALGQATTGPAPGTPQVADVFIWSRWACILAGLALLGVLWIIWNMQTLARNQVTIARMIRDRQG